MIRRVRDFIWPVAGKATAAELAADAAAKEAEIQAIRAADLSNEVALEEARRLSGDEEDRRKTAESKATNALLVIGALVPLLTYLFSEFCEEVGVGDAPRWLTLVLLLVAVAYLLAGARWAFKTIGISNYHRVYAPEIVAALAKGAGDARSNLAKELLAATRHNQDVVNTKVSRARLAQAFLLRATVAFCLLLAVHLVWALWNEAISPLLEWVCAAVRPD